MLRGVCKVKCSINPHTSKAIEIPVNTLRCLRVYITLKAGFVTVISHFQDQYVKQQANDFLTRIFFRHFWNLVVRGATLPQIMWRKIPIASGQLIAMNSLFYSGRRKTLAKNLQFVDAPSRLRHDRADRLQVNERLHKSDIWLEAVEQAKRIRSMKLSQFGMFLLCTIYANVTN